LDRVKKSLRPSSPTSGRVKNHATTTSSSVDSPRKKAKPRTGPTVSTYSRKAPMKLETSAVRIVLNARWKPRSTDDRIVLPLRISSLRRSKYTT
jgi:hypothetical protein